MENEKLKGEEHEELGEFCAGCGKPVWLDAHVYFNYSAIAYIFDRVQWKTLDIDVAQPKSAGGCLTLCYQCSTSGANPFIDAALLRRIVAAAKTLEKQNAAGSKGFWKGLAAKFLPS